MARKHHLVDHVKKPRGSDLHLAPVRQGSNNGKGAKAAKYREKSRKAA